MRALILIVAALPAFASAATLREVTVDHVDGTYVMRSEAWFDVGIEKIFGLLLDWDESTKFSSVVVESRNLAPAPDGRGRFFEKPEFMTNVSKEELDDFTKAVIPFRITGPLADPDIRPDVEEMLKDRAEKEAKKALADKLLGDDKEPPAEGEEPQEEKDIEDQLKDEAKKRLRDLLGGD